MTRRGTCPKCGMRPDYEGHLAGCPEDDDREERDDSWVERQDEMLERKEDADGDQANRVV